MHLPTLKNDRITIRPLKRSDVEALRDNVNDRQIAKFMPSIPYPYTLDHARKFINLAHCHARTNKAYHFGITESGTDEIIGVIGLKNVNLHSMNAELEYWVGQNYRRKGIASDALSLILKFTFGNLKLNRLYAVVLDKNIASVRLLKKQGLLREGVFRKAFKSGKTAWSDVLFYGILREEFVEH